MEQVQQNTAAEPAEAVEPNSPQNQAFAYMKGIPNPCPAFLLTIKLSSFKPYTLFALLDSGADCNLARPQCFPIDCWETTSTSIHSVSHSNNPIGFQATVPIQFLSRLYPATFLQFPIEQYDCIIGSETLQAWSPYTVGHVGSHITFKFGSIPQINEYRAYSPKLAFPAPPTPVRPGSRAWFITQSFSTWGDLALIQAEFAKTIMTKDLTKYAQDLECSLPLKKDENGKPIVPKGRANYLVLSREEQDLCEKEIADLLSKGIIRPSTSPFSCHVMYVPKKDEHGNEIAEKRLVVNYRPLNACLESNQHPLPNKDYIWQRI